MAGANEEFISNLTRNQRRLYAYLVTVLGDRDLADECLQRTNIVLWRKADEFEPGTNFEAWSTAIAKLQAKAARKTAVRERRLLSEASFDAIADAADADENADQRTEALRRCLELLSPRQFDALRVFYGAKRGIAQAASSLGLGLGAMKSLLHRTRVQLLDCVQRRLSEEHPA